MNVLVGYGTQVRIAWKQLRPPNQNPLNGATCVDPINATHGTYMGPSISFVFLVDRNVMDLYGAALGELLFW